MPVIVNFRTEVRPYSGYAERQFPIGAWIASGTLTGDASGGFVQANFLFQFGQQALVTEMYNLEQFSVDMGVAAAPSIQAELQTRNMDILAPGRTIGVQRWQFALLSDGAGNSINQLADQAGLPIWLGAPHTPLLECGIRWQFVNALDQVFTITCQGYIWGSRSVLAPGGPQRPPFGIFGK